LEQNIEFYRNKADEQFKTIEELKQQVDNLKNVISSNLPPYLNAFIEYL
jgi:predicted  nucleic acid-binding Zn-ribbon protein